MLPGFRFLFAAILLSTSILVFGLGAAALLRASHEQYANDPSWRSGPPEQRFAQAPEPAQPVLAVLRAEPEVTAEPEPSLRDQVPTIGLPESEPEQAAALTTEADDVPTQVTAPPEQAAAVEPARAETTPQVTEPAPADTLTPADALTPADNAASIPEAKPADVATAGEPPAAAPSAVPASSALDIAAAKAATPKEPTTTVATDAPAKAKTDIKADIKADTKSDSKKADSGASESKATKRKAKAKKRQRVVRRPPPQQQLDPFGQQQPAFATTTPRTR